MYGQPAEAVLNLALEAVTRRLFEEIIRREVSWENSKLHDIPEDWKYILDKAFKDDHKGLGIKFSLRRPVVAIGAPAGALMPDVAKSMDVEIIVPEHADVGKMRLGQ